MKEIIKITEEEYNAILIYMWKRYEELKAYPQLKGYAEQQLKDYFQFRDWKTLNYCRYEVQ
jgi:hypothetical protein